MNQEDIMKIIPHRDQMLLIDEVIVDGEWALGTYHVRGDEWFLKGHFPGNPVVPGVILCEILAQSSCVLLRDVMAEKGALPMYTGLNNVKFRHPVKPGDTFTTKCRIKRQMGNFYFAEGSGFVGEDLCIKAEFSFAIVEQ